MYRIRDFYHDVFGLDDNDIDLKIVCETTDIHKTLLTNKMQDTLAAYTFTLVEQGWLTLFYNNRKLTLSPGDLYIYSPGFQVRIDGGSDDYRGICLMADEEQTLEMPTVRNIIRAAYLPVTELGQPVVHIPDDSRERIAGRMREIIDYQYSQHCFRAEASQMLFTLFLLDLGDVQERTVGTSHLSGRSVDIYIAFMRLLPKHFIEHRDLAFYASELCISTTHLSRVVRQVSGRTVGDYIGQMLLMEAAWLLKSTDFPIADIADRLRFADQSSFSRFFTHHKGLTPKSFRQL